MAGLPARNVSEYDRHEHTSKKRIVNSSISHRPSSVKPSMRSSRSRITLVGYDAELDFKLDTAYGTARNAKVFTWLDHLLAVFCIHRQGRDISSIPARSIQGEEDEGHHPSPWILPVYVLSTQRDESRHFIPKEAKCTIDTGNLQGNIASKTFVTDVLGYPESSFQPLTKLEEAGGIGVTGHKLIPQGAIYLTWYHSNSTRIFREMRFLISEHPMYDLIIGSRSIHQNGILDVPNLGDIIQYDEKKDAERLEKLRGEMNDAKIAWTPFEKKVLKGSKDSKVQAQEKELKNKFEAAKVAFNTEGRQLALRRIYSREQKHKKKEVELRKEFLVYFHEEVPPEPPAESHPSETHHPKAKGD